MLKKPPVLLVTMPWDVLSSPSIRLGLLKSVLKEKGYKAKTIYLSLSFMEYVLKSQAELPEDLKFTLYDYWRIANERYGFALGDWLFTHAVYENPPCSPEKYFSWLRREGASKEYIAKLEALRSLVKPFLNWCLKKIPWEKHRIVGFTTTFNQNIPSLALSKLMKESFPGCFIVFGGANCEGPMGAMLIKHFPWIDAVIRGEGENALPGLVEAILEGRQVPALSGLCLRKEGSLVVQPEQPDGLANMDENPIPDYDDYFESLGKTSFSAQISPNLFVETSRGCWWGMKTHCTFCGLNGFSINFRSKSPKRALHEYKVLAERYKILNFDAVDNIMDMHYFNSLLPMLKDLGLSYEIFYEMKVNLKKHQIRLLREAGVVRVQGGLESLSSKHLGLMRKGATAIQNIQFLKWCLEYGIYVNWNYLYAIPGEDPGDYDQTSDLVDWVSHLVPPTLMIPISLDRFSPYFTRPHEFGIKNLWPSISYGSIYPWSEQDLFDVAYSFYYDCGFQGNPEEYTKSLREKLAEWRNNFATNLLSYSRGPNFLKIEDFRGNVSPKLVILDKQQAEVYLLCDEARSAGTIYEELSKRFGKETMDFDSLLRFLRDMISLRVMYQENERFLSLAVPYNTDFAFIAMAKEWFKKPKDRKPWD